IDGCPGDILRIRGKAEDHLRLVRFRHVLQQIRKSRGAADHQGKHARRHRIQRAGVPDAPLAEQPARFRHHVVARHAGRLVDRQHALQSHAINPRRAPTIVRTASGKGMWSVTPAARTWPPPPNDLAKAATSTVPADRRLTFTLPSSTSLNKMPTSTPSMLRE